MKKGFLNKVENNAAVQI
ncbi:hypothetical protein Gohar_020599 [Gossypium harknessii]|uniref:Uncharacterized protein n=1 Tax=Gossypium harknessii TaxID=34285 RepID=A0A7J9HYR0_9ROSI|nr:hypothetical protein [Gossypium harknessii]